MFFNFQFGLRDEIFVLLCARGLNFLRCESKDETVRVLPYKDSLIVVESHTKPMIYRTLNLLLQLFIFPEIELFLLAQFWEVNPVCPELIRNTCYILSCYLLKIATLFLRNWDV